jgi:hypothetical protein
MNNNNNNNGLNFMKLFMTMQDMSMNKATLKERVQAKERIVFATPGIIKPSNWETLSDSEKLKRLNKVQQQ